MMQFHRRCGDRITLLHNHLTAFRNFVEFNHGLILSRHPLKDDIMFEVCIDRKVNVWNGSLEIGVTTQNPEYLELPATATKLRNTAWILSGNSIVKDGVTQLASYSPELDLLHEGDCVGVMRSSAAELLFFINGRCLGVAAQHMPPRLFAVVDLYGQCVQVTLIPPSQVIPNPMLSCTLTEDDLNDDTLTSSDIEAPEEEDPDNARDGREEYVPLPTTVFGPNNQERLRFHTRCGILAKISNHNKTAERTRPMDDYNNAVVMTNRPMRDDETFEIRVDRLVPKWSGSIEVGVTNHNPATIRFPSTMTTMDSGTVMLSGSKVLVNGQGTFSEYGHINLDELRVGDTVGMMKKRCGHLHYYINGLDQGIAARNVEQPVWGVVDLYGMTTKVTIVDPYEEIDTNLQESPPLPSVSVLAGLSELAPPIDEDSLLFHSLRDSNVIITNDGKTAHRPNALNFFNNGLAITNRKLKSNELFQVRLDQVIPKWAGSIEIGVTRRASSEIEFPFRLSSDKSGTWALADEDVIRNGTIMVPQYSRNLNRLLEGDTVGVMRSEFGVLHFYINGEDQGPAAYNIPADIYGIVDLYGRVSQATIVRAEVDPPVFTPESPSSPNSMAYSYPEMCFHRVHGRNAILSRSRLTAFRSAVFSEFNDAVLFSSQPLRECYMFELRIDSVVDCWIGSIEFGVTAMRPEDLEGRGAISKLAGTATELIWNTYILSGSAIMKDGECIRSGYRLDLDNLTVGSRVGIMRHSDRTLHFYLDGMDMGAALYVPDVTIYAVVDLYGQCSQVTILQNEGRPFNHNAVTTSDNSLLSMLRRLSAPPQPYWTFSEYCGENATVTEDYVIAKRRSKTEPTGALVFSSAHLAANEMFEVRVVQRSPGYAGGIRFGVTDINILNANVNRNLPASVRYLPHFTTYIDGKCLYCTKPGAVEKEIKAITPSLQWLRVGDRIGLRRNDADHVEIYFNNSRLDFDFENVPNKVYAVFELYGDVYKVQAVSKRVTNVLPAEYQIEPVVELEDDMTYEEPDEMMETSGVEKAPATKPPMIPRSPLPYTFHYIHGTNIELISSNTVAVRFRGYKDALAISCNPIRRGQSMSFRVDMVKNEMWHGGLGIGALTCLPTTDVPERCLMIPAPSWVVTSDICYDNGQISRSRTTEVLDEMTEQSIVTVDFRDDSKLAIILDGQQLKIAGVVPDAYNEVYPFLDLYGKVLQASIMLHSYDYSDLKPKSTLAVPEYAETVTSLDDSEAGPSGVITMPRLRAQSVENFFEISDTFRYCDSKPKTFHGSLLFLELTSPRFNIDRSIPCMRKTVNEFVRKMRQYTYLDDILMNRPFCDTNIQQNDRFPEANDVDRLDFEIVDALTLETGNLPDLTEEQSSSIDESTRRDDICSDTLSAENLNYLNKILSLDQVEEERLEWDWDVNENSCPYLLKVLKYCTVLLQPYPTLSRLISWGEPKCYCISCEPCAPLDLTGWVRIERIDLVATPTRAYWPFARSTLGAARGSCGRARRPPALTRSLAGTHDTLHDIWRDNDGKAHQVTVAIEINVEGTTPDKDSMLAVLFCMTPRVTVEDEDVEDNAMSFEE